MSYLTYEQSDFGGHPVELYRFATGTDVYCYTSADEAVALAEDTYDPVYISRSGFTRSSDVNKGSLQIEVAADNPLALRFRTGWLPGVMVATVSRLHRDDGEAAVIWKGRVTGCTWSGSVARLSTESVFTMFKRAGLRRTYQITCPHQLYGDACRAVAGAFRYVGAVTSVAGVVIAVAGIDAFPAGYFVGGIFKMGDEQRLITGHSGGTVTLIAGIDGLAPGDTAELWPGCDRTTETCINRFGNLDNYGGFPYLPSKNPFSGDAIV